MLIRILRNPEGADSAGTATAEIADTHSTDTEAAAEGSQSQATTTQTQASEKKAAAKAPAASPVNERSVLKDALAKKQKDPDCDLSETEWAALDKHFEGKLDLEGDEGAEEKAETEQTEEVKKTDDKAKGPAAPVLSELQKELNVTSDADLLKKVKELKAFTGSRDAQNFAKLERDHKSLLEATKPERALWDDVKAGRPEAIEFLERAAQTARQKFNLPATQASTTQARPGAQAGSQKVFVDPSKFAFPEDAAAINEGLAAHFGEMRGLIEKQAETIRRLEEKDGRREQQAIMSQAETSQMEEILAVSSLIPELKNIPALRDKVAEWIRNPKKEFPELKILDQLFEVANKNGTNLRISWDSIEADRLRSKVARAKDEGVNEAYRHQPNTTLSDVQGRAANQQYKTYSEDQLLEMASDYTKIPDDWFKPGTDDLDYSRMPVSARKFFEGHSGA